eukprot:2647829-Prymnesium_polylepis.1
MEGTYVAHAASVTIPLARAKPSSSGSYAAEHSAEIASVRLSINSQPMPTTLPEGSEPEAAAHALCLRGSADEKATFLRDEWMPFYSELREALLITESRSVIGVELESVLPPQADWERWTHRCRELTARWHGRPNVAAVFELLVECS